MIHPFVKASLSLLAAAVLAACRPGAPPPADRPEAGTGAISPAAIEAHMRFLASDLLEGREAGTRGYDLAASYLAAQFRLIGLEPAGDDGSYFQPVPLQAHWLERDGSRMVVTRPDGVAAPQRLGEDFVVSSSAVQAASRVAAGAVFVGYGIHAPEFNHDDYAGLDVRGRIVVAFAGYPVAFPGEEGAHYGSSRQKAVTAAERGAVGFVQIYTERYEAVRPWDRVVRGLGEMSMTWVGPDGQPFTAAPGIQASASMSPAGGAVLFQGAPRSYDEVRAEAATGAPRGFPLAVTLDIAQASRLERRASANVVARLEGADPVLRDEFVVVLGHLDHEGIAAPVAGDAIYNGALDNAAGIAAMLEAARALVAQAERPRRSVLFLAVTAEEKGLVGSDYFAGHPTVPMSSVVAAMNLDMPILLYDFTDVIAFGAQHSSLGTAVESALREAGITSTPDPMPEQTIFVRSDHYSFVRRGVPSIFLTTGWDSTQGKGTGGAQFTGFLAGNYHSPKDDLAQPIDFAAGAKFARVNALILRGIADADARPRWNDGDFFGRLFAAGR